MYKLRFYDACCCPICDGTADFFTDDIEQFERVWFSRRNKNPEQEKRYLRSKAGENVSDYYTDSPEYNIFQHDENAEVHAEKKYELGERSMILANVYGWESTVYISSGEVSLRSIRFGGRYYLAGKYCLNGVCSKPMFMHRFQPDNCESIYPNGNPVFIRNVPSRKIWYDDVVPDAPRLDYPREEFAGDWIETCCWLTVGYPEAPEPLPESLSDEFLRLLMRDIPGEAG